MEDHAPVMIVEAQAEAGSIDAQVVNFDVPAPTDAIMQVSDRYQIDMCLTPRPFETRACYLEHWGPHRFERVGDIFMVPPGERLNFRGIGGPQASITCQLPSVAIGAVMGEAFSWSDRQLAATLDISSASVRALLLRLAGELRHPGLASAQMVELLGGELTIEIARFCLDVSERPMTGGLSGWRLRLIDQRLSDDPSAPALSELAEMCNLSVRQLTRGFKVSRGCSIGDYIEQRRMDTAKRLLTTEESIKTIAFAMGFSSPSSFTYAFRRAAGFSPSQFRQRHKRALGGALGQA
ncbi:MAG: helix-turn-helix transcriptional regulator [Novosphingobium sp.]